MINIQRNPLEYFVDEDASGNDDINLKNSKISYQKLKFKIISIKLKYFHIN